MRVKPGAKSTGVGGTWGEDGPLNVVVRERAVDGQANEAVRQLLATVLGVRKRQIKIVSGHRSRVKLIEAFGEVDELKRRLEGWRAR